MVSVDVKHHVYFNTLWHHLTQSKSGQRFRQTAYINSLNNNWIRACMLQSPHPTPTTPNVFMSASLFNVYNKTHEDTSCPKYISLKHLLKFYMPCMSAMPCKVTQITNVVCVYVCVFSVMIWKEDADPYIFKIKEKAKCHKQLAPPGHCTSSSEL